jgi:hypothetical protein
LKIRVPLEEESLDSGCPVLKDILSLAKDASLLTNVPGDDMGNENEARTNPKTTGQPQMYRVIADYQALYPDPLSMRAGEPLNVSEKAEYWNDNPDWMWIWCTDQRGKSGWVPKGGIDFHATGTTGTARYDYTATELTVAVGEELVVEREESGWLWCTDQQGKSGWVPADHVTES